jgi:hypothetical protein
VAPRRDLVGGAGGPAVRAQKGVIERLYTAPPEGGVVVCLDEMGPQSAKSYPGRRVVKPAGPEAQRVTQEIDWSRGGKGYVFAAFRPATGEAFTATYVGRTIVNRVDFLGAAYLNLIEPCWKILRSLALKSRRFEAWPEIQQAVRRATAYRNEHKHPFLWGRRRRHRAARRPGVAAVPNAPTT